VPVVREPGPCPPARAHPHDSRTSASGMVLGGVAGVLRNPPARVGRAAGAGRCARRGAWRHCWPRSGSRGVERVRSTRSRRSPS